MLPNTSKKQWVAFQEQLSVVFERGGPEHSEYARLNDAFNQFYQCATAEDIAELQKTITFLLNDDAFQSSTFGHAFCKPHGYAGDFELIDKMYQQTVSGHAMYRKWDEFYHWHAAARAVRNRKAYFKYFLTTKLEGTSKPFRILNIASGPCRDVLEALEEHPQADMHFDCVEMDLNAILHAVKLNKSHLPHLTFFNKNVFRFTPKRRYPFIWSAGLFDYFDDYTFTRMLDKMLNWLEPGGELVIGNFSEANPTRGYMEVLCDWKLHHRDQTVLLDLARQTGLPMTKIRIGQEPAGVNLFLHIQK